MRFAVPILLSIAAACGTPKVAQEYETKTYGYEEIQAALASDSPARRADAAEQISNMEPEKRKGVLVELTRDPRPETRLLAVSLLGKHHAADPDVIAAMGDVATLDPDVDVRTAALGALAMSGRVKALDTIAAVLTDDPSMVVRREAAVLLDRVTGQTLGAEFAGHVDAASDSADDAAMAYDDWLETNGANLRWDEKSGRFAKAEDAKP